MWVDSRGGGVKIGLAVRPFRICFFIIHYNALLPKNRARFSVKIEKVKIDDLLTKIVDFGDTSGNQERFACGKPFGRLRRFAAAAR
ncbi:MAG: hypothetical protein IJ484_08485 [Oscillospiraceae bacterium]|nr:hypothetical protein [Oscillospiraceae bacterium]